MSAPTSVSNPSRSGLVQFLHEWRWALLLVALVALVRFSVVNHYVVPTGSMQPALMPGDRVLVDMRAYGWRPPFSSTAWWGASLPRSGDVVLFFSPSNGARVVKRVVAVGGDEVAVLNGRLYLNGQAVAVSDTTERIGQSLVELDLNDGPGPPFGPVVVPEGKLLVVGDHRGKSLDGRSFGWVDAKSVYGRAKGVFWRSSPTWLPLSTKSTRD